ncbi:uncharacterized protein Z520_04926 [Fonsecaea multimorphosa CBS 102226]|uniref:Uncharacterized protein n=1 Tax=Fonsecaea multimorphosa CBS 102226 TaxID=1442371 RepID=A0A0D2HBT5_9EURO|nr:uncharacterized protein Z520_04926 [Fonsecaea multimorphosa CBS 102226]KIX99350.1 hypothetical protein Z520_04926 [Fonsecaea multimorphosa CBS 102226]OAL25681.1 hypothetical protein AYO22_04670 [Fonsecaea multimorphosa]
MVAWVVVTTRWTLAEVQAVIAVIITLVCFLASSTVSRLFWQTSAVRLSNNRNVPVSSLVTSTSPSEVWDVLRLFKFRLFSSRHRGLAIQGMLVVLLNVCGILAGVIAKVSTRTGSITPHRTTQGDMATRSMSDEIDNSVRWQKIMDSLDQAQFPRDQLLDFLPDLNSDWVYKAEDWNSTFAVQCHTTPQTLISLEAVGNYTYSFTGLSALYEVPGLWSLFSDEWIRDAYMYDTKVYGQWTTTTSTTFWDYGVIWITSTVQPSNTSNDMTDMSVALIAVCFRHSPYPSDPDVGSFGIGPLEQSFFTKVECDITRKRPDEFSYFEAYPNVFYNNSHLSAMLHSQFWPNLFRPTSDGNTQINAPSGEEMFRLYQAYTISKDTFYPHPVTREISTRVRTVEVSIAFLIVAAAVISSLLVGFIRILLLWKRHHHIIKDVPESKIDWMIQSLQGSNVKRSSVSSSPGLTMPAAATGNGYLPLSSSMGRDLDKLDVLEGAVFNVADGVCTNPRSANSDKGLFSPTTLPVTPRRFGSVNGSPSLSRHASADPSSGQYSELATLLPTTSNLWVRAHRSRDSDSTLVSHWET